MNPKKKLITIFISFSGQGGVERMVCNLAQGFLDMDYEVDMVLARAGGEHLGSIPEGVRQVRLGTRHTFSALPAFTAYLRREKPSVLLAAKDRAIKVAVVARFLARSNTFLVGRIGTTVSAALEGRHPLKRFSWFLGIRSFYRLTDHIVAVSEGVAKDVIRITSLPPGRVTTIRNPVVTPGLYKLAAEPVSHPWFQDTRIPVIIGIGRLTKQKDFSTLIRAFAKVRREKECRLLVLGDGKQLPELKTLAAKLKVENDIDLPGFLANPYSVLSKCSLFVLSSRWEGSPNALTEALALGIPVVSTDCPSGPREILNDGEFGRMVPVGDVDSMAAAISRTLDAPPESDYLREAVKEYEVRNSAISYLKVMDLK
jgi:glycosyltransferase involved in cell wall biosynthesis